MGSVIGFQFSRISESYERQWTILKNESFWRIQFGRFIFPTKPDHIHVDVFTTICVNRDNAGGHGPLPKPWRLTIPTPSCNRYDSSTAASAQVLGRHSSLGSRHSALVPPHTPQSRARPVVWRSTRFISRPPVFTVGRLGKTWPRRPSAAGSFCFITRSRTAVFGLVGRVVWQQEWVTLAYCTATR